MKHYLTATVVFSTLWVIIGPALGVSRDFLMSPWPGAVAAGFVLLGFREQLQFWKWPMLVVLGGALNYLAVLVAATGLWTPYLMAYVAAAAALGALSWGVVLRLLVFGSDLQWSVLLRAPGFCLLSVFPLMVLPSAEVDQLRIAAHTALWWIMFAIAVAIASRQAANFKLQRTAVSGR